LVLAERAQMAVARLLTEEILHLILLLEPAAEQEVRGLVIKQVQTVDAVEAAVEQVERLVQAHKDMEAVQEVLEVVAAAVAVWGRQAVMLHNLQVGLEEMEEMVLVMRLRIQPI